MSAARPQPPFAGPALTLPVTLERGFSLSAWSAMFWIAVEQFIRGRRLLALSAIFALPTLLALVARYYSPDHASPEYRDGIVALENLLIFYMIPQALVPLTALILASGIIRDEVEGQTLTYLLIRPLPRPSIYLAKLAAAWCVATSVAAVFVTAAVIAIHWGADDFWGVILPGRAARLVALTALSMLVYVTLFGALGLVVKWVLPFGVAYIVMFEGVFANVDFMVRRLTVLWYVRVLAERWFGMHVDSWTIDLESAPSGTEALVTLLLASAVIAGLSSYLFGAREIRVKTPEGS